jgi:hypothetical protein
MLEADIGEDKNNLSVIKRGLGLFFCGISLRAYVNHLRNPREMDTNDSGNITLLLKIIFYFFIGIIFIIVEYSIY